MPDEAVVEAEPVAEPTVEASPEVVTPEVVTTGDAPEVVEGEWEPDFTTDEWEALLKKAPPEVLDKAEPIQERVQAADQRRETREREYQASKGAVDEGFSQLVSAGQQAQDYLAWAGSELQTVQREIDWYSDPDHYEPDKLKAAQQRQSQVLNTGTLQNAVAAAEAGASARADLETRKWQTIAIGEVAGELKIDLAKEPFSEQDMQQFEQARYEDAQRGQIGNRATKLLMQKLVERHGRSEFERGKQAGLKDRQAQLALVDKIKDLKAARNGAPALNGGAAAGGSLTLEEAQTLPIDELIRRSKAQ